jgi:serine/threonine-protein kinase
VLPGAKAVLFTAHTSEITGFDVANVEVMTLRDHRRKTLQRGGSFARYLPSGHLVYVNRGSLFAVHFDLDRLEVRGTPIPILNPVAYAPLYGLAQIDFSQTGTVVYRKGGAGEGLATVQWLDPAGKTSPVIAKPGGYRFPRQTDLIRIYGFTISSAEPACA